MRLDDGPGDGQPEPGAGPGGDLAAAREHVEQCAAVAGGEAGAAIANPDGDAVVECFGGDLDRRACRCELGGVLQQVAENALEQDGVELQQRQVGGQPDADGVVGQCAAEKLDAGADDFLEWLPFAAQRDLAGVEAGHVEQVADQSGKACGLLVHRLRRFQRRPGQRRADQRQRVGEPDQRRQRRPQVVRQGGEDRTAQAFGDHVELRRLRHVDVMQALDGDGKQRRERFEQRQALRLQGRRAGREGHGEHAAHPLRGA